MRVDDAFLFREEGVKHSNIYHLKVEINPGKPCKYSYRREKVIIHVTRTCLFSFRNHSKLLNAAIRVGAVALPRAARNASAIATARLHTYPIRIFLVDRRHHQAVHTSLYCVAHTPARRYSTPDVDKSPVDDPAVHAEKHTRCLPIAVPFGACSPAQMSPARRPHARAAPHDLPLRGAARHGTAKRERADGPVCPRPSPWAGHMASPPEPCPLLHPSPPVTPLAPSIPPFPLPLSSGY